MKNTLVAIISALAVTVSVSMAQITNPIPYADTYENYAAGSNLVGTVWQGDTSTPAIAVVTNLTYATPAAGYPTTAPTHTNVMEFKDGPITNEFDGTGLTPAELSSTVVALDTMINPSYAETPSDSQMGPVSNSLVSLYFDTNRYVNVFHGDVPGSIGLPATKRWSTFSQGFSPVISGSWNRITVTLKFVNYGSLDGKMAWIKTSLNGQDLTNSSGKVEANIGASDGGAWFVAPSWDDLNFTFHRVVLTGSGMLDDMVVTTNEITYASQGGSGYATNGVPIDWMTNTCGMVTNALFPTYDQLALGDWDNDGAPTWTERLAGTDPTNEFSKLVIISSTFSNGYPVLKWIGTTNAMNPYNVQWSSNLTIISGWTTITGGLPRGDSSHSTNEVTLPSAPTNFTPVFLRVTVTN